MRHSILLFIAAALLTGCSSLPERGPDPAPSPAPPSVEMIQAAQLARYATDLQALVHGNRTVQAELVNSARLAYDDAKAGPAALRYGLMLAAPAHPLRDARLANHVLQEAMARPELLTVAERALGAVEISRVDTELRLVTEVERLVAELQKASERLRAAEANTTLNRRLQAEMEESARLRKALDEAKAKLDAITRMERNLPDRPSAPEGRTP
jgi:DNA polymerase I-like protein with 3'-5' exonuclease and polymerase domains